MKYTEGIVFYFGTKEQCEEYDEIVTLGEGYNGQTKTWAVVYEVDNVFYVRLHPSYLSDMETVEILPNIEIGE